MKDVVTRITASFIAGAALTLTVLAITKSPTEENGMGEREEREFQNLMRPHDAESVLSIIDTEGFDAAFRHYSNYRDISDPQFHQLKANYIDAARELLDYVQQANQKTD
jgi:hypothetical protein